MATDPAARPQSDDRTAALQAEGRQMQSDLLYTEKAQFAAAERLQQTHRLVGLTATLLSAAAAASILADHPAVAGVLALSAALASGVLTFLKPDQQAATHLAAGRQLGVLRVELRQLVHLDLNHLPEPEVRAALADIASRKADIDNAAPGTTERHFKIASAKVDRGDFEP
jgi:hypothetical protein